MLRWAQTWVTYTVVTASTAGPWVHVKKGIDSTWQACALVSEWFFLVTAAFFLVTVPSHFLVKIYEHILKKERSINEAVLLSPKYFLKKGHCSCSERYTSNSHTVSFWQMKPETGGGRAEGRPDEVVRFSKSSKTSFYTVANVPFGLASNLCVGRFSEINKILLYNRGYGVIKRVKILMERKSPTNHLWL